MQTPSIFSVPPRGWLAPALLAVVAVALAGCASAPSVDTTAPAPLAVSAPPTPTLADELDHSQQFARWVTDFSTRARAAGIDEATLHSAFDNVRFLPRLIELDRAQPEFTRTVGDYLGNALSAQRIARGQDKLQQLRPVVEPLAARYGVPAETLFAIWGMESNFGSFVGDIPTSTP